MTGKSDWKYIDFSADHEMNYILEKYNYPQTNDNRAILRKWGQEAKQLLGKVNLTHTEFYQFICTYKGHC